MAKKKATSTNALPEDTSSSNLCFTVMPFGGWFDFYYEDIFIPAIQAAGLTPRRADDLYRPSAIVHDIWSLTQKAKMILADLTGKNPNVFYELGLAHALAKPAILVTESMDDVPFDLRSLRVIVYDKNKPDWGKALQEQIKASIKEIMASPLDAVLPTFLKVKDSGAKPTVTQAEKELLSMRQDIDLLKRELRRSDSFIPTRPRVHSDRESVEYIRNLANRGLPKGVILDNLIEAGAPKEIAIRLVESFFQRYALSPELPLAATPAEKANEDEPK